MKEGEEEHTMGQIPIRLLGGTGPKGTHGTVSQGLPERQPSTAKTCILFDMQTQPHFVQRRRRGAGQDQADDPLMDFIIQRKHADPGTSDGEAADQA